MVHRYLLLICFLLCSRVSYEQTRPPVSCGTSDVAISPALQQLMQRLSDDTSHAKARMAAAPMLECRLGIDVDYATYQHFNRDVNQIRQYILSSIDAVSRIYEDEINVHLTVTRFQIWNTPDPYPTTTNLTTHLGSVESWWRKQSEFAGAFDGVIGFTTKQDPVYGGIANIGGGKLGLCGVVGYVKKNYQQTQIVAHELGHMFGSVHTHNCNWPGGPIDFCAAAEGCTQTYPTEDQLGTIMSYCARVLTFHPYCRTVMRQTAESHGLKQWAGQPETPRLILSASLPTNYTSPRLNWTASIHTVNYQVQLATDSTFTKLVADTLIKREQWQAASLKPGQEYYWRVKALGETSRSAWSSIGEITVPPAVPDEVPALRHPADQTILAGIRQISWYPVPNAKRYRAQVSSGSTFDSYLQQDQLIDGTSMMLNSDLGCWGCPMYWRVRVEDGNQTSSWSEPYLFKIPPSVEHTTPEDYLLDSWRYTTSFATSASVNYEPNTQVTFQLSTKADFGSLSFNRSRMINTAGSPYYEIKTHFFADSLTPGTPYYYRIKAETNGVAGSWKTGSFRTGYGRSVWRFVNDANSTLNMGGSIARVAINQKGVIWLGGGTGLYRSENDGKDWVRFTYQMTKIPMSSVGDLALDSQQRLWVVTQYVLARFDGENWQQFSLPVDVTGGTYARIAIARNNNIYLVKGGKLLLFNVQTQTWSTFPTIPSNLGYLYDCVVDRNENVWISGYSSLVQYDGTKWVIHTTGNNTLPSSINNLRVATDTSGSQIWLSGRFGVARWLGGRQWSITYSYQLRSQGDNICNLAFDRKNNLWVAGMNALYQYDGQQWRATKEPSLWYSVNNSNMTADYSNRLWMTTEYGAGIAIYDGRNIRPKLSADQFCTGDTLQLTFDSDFVSTSSTQFIVEATDSLGKRYTRVPALISNNTARIAALHFKAGQSYRLRMTATNPSIEGEVSTSFRVTSLPASAITPARNTTLCEGQSLTLTASASSLGNQWMLDEIPIAGATANAYVPTKTGSYRIRQDVNGCRVLSEPTRIVIGAIPTSTLTAQGATEVYEPARVLLTSDLRNAPGYEWFRDGVKLTDASSFSTNVEQSGSYTVRITSPDGCTALSNAVIIRVNKVLAVEPVEQEILFTPNPVNQQGRLVLPAAWRRGIKVTLVNSTGQVIWHQAIDNNPGHIDINTQVLTPGLYVLQLEYQQEKRTIKVIRH